MVALGASVPAALVPAAEAFASRRAPPPPPAQSGATSATARPHPPSCRRCDPVARSPRSGAALGVPTPRVTCSKPAWLSAMQAQQEENVATSPRVSETAPPSTRADARAAGRGALPSLKQVKQPPRRNVAGERSGHGRASATAREWLDFVVPKTAVPEDYHVRETRPVRPDDDEYHAAWDEATKCWQVTIFPSRFPSQREQVSLLRDCLNRMLQAELEHLGLPPGSNLLALLERAEDFDAAYAAVTSIYTAGVQEVSRQVSVHCVERAHLLQSVWSASELLRVRAMAIKEGRISELAAKLDELQAEHRGALERLEATSEIEAMLAAKNEEVQRLLHSKERLVLMVKSLQSALYSAEEQLRASQESRALAESSLRTWLPRCEEYSSPAALETLEAHAAAPLDVTQGPTGGLIARVERWRAKVREQAAQLADWEQPPQLPDRTSMSADASRAMLRDAERILAVLLCMQAPADADAGADAEPSAREASEGGAAWESERRELKAAAARAADEAARYQGLIAGLQTQLSAAQTHALELEATVAQLRGASPSAPARADVA